MTEPRDFDTPADVARLALELVFHEHYQASEHHCSCCEYLPGWHMNQQHLADAAVAALIDEDVIR